MSITIRISVIAALLIAVSNAVPQRNGDTNHQLLDDDIETNHQLLDDDALSVLCSKLDKATLRSASETSHSMRARIMPIVLLHRLFRSFVESSDPLLAARNFNDLDDKHVCQQAINDQISLLSKFKFEEEPHNLYFDNEFFNAFKSYLELSSGGLLRDHGIPEPIVHELTRDRGSRSNFCNPGEGSLNYAKLVLQLGADPFGDGSENPPLHAACGQGSIDVVNELFRFTGSQQLLTRVMSSDNENALHRLASHCYGSAEIGRLILESSPDAKGMITAIDSVDKNPLNYATWYGNCNLLSLYLHNLGNLDRDLFASLMETAIRRRHIDIVRLLLPFGREWLVDLDLRQHMLAHAKPAMRREVKRLINDSLESEFVDQ